MLMILKETKALGLVTREWRVGEGVLADYDDITSIRADGEELNYICDAFLNLPHPDVNVTGREYVWWFGDNARFIVANL